MWEDMVLVSRSSVRDFPLCFPLSVVDSNQSLHITFMLPFKASAVAWLDNH